MSKARWHGLSGRRLHPYLATAIRVDPSDRRKPVFSPLGLDWRYGVAIIASFLAREVFVGTLGTIFGIQTADEDPAPLADQIAASGLTVASGAALVVFFTIALQCVSTVALLAREAKSARFAVALMAGYLVLAWLAAFVVYQLAGVLLS